MTAGDVELRRFSLVAPDRERTRLAGLLSADERARAARFHRTTERLRFVVGRARLRLLLGRHTGDAPARLRFIYGEHGKPALRDHPTLRFNLAHTGDRALVAITRGRDVGVDLEPLARGRELEEAAHTFFSPAERAALAIVDATVRSAAIVRCWCRKEAYLKARGDGLTRPLASFDVAVVTERSLASGSLLLATRPDAAEVRAWDLCDVEAGTEYAAALAVERLPARVAHVREAALCGADESGGLCSAP